MSIRLKERKKITIPYTVFLIIFLPVKERAVIKTVYPSNAKRIDITFTITLPTPAPAMTPARTYTRVIIVTMVMLESTAAMKQSFWL